MKMAVLLLGLLGLGSFSWADGISLLPQELKAKCSGGFLDIYFQTQLAYSPRPYYGDYGKCEIEMMKLNTLFSAAEVTQTKIKFRVSDDGPLDVFVLDLPPGEKLKVSPSTLKPQCENAGDRFRLVVLSGDKPIYRTTEYEGTWRKPCEKDVAKLKTIFTAAEASGKKVAFELNYSFYPASDFSISL